MSSIYVICLVTQSTVESLNAQALYVKSLEAEGHHVFYPARDTDQEAGAWDINRQNLEAIRDADEVHVFYSQTSHGVHFDLGMAFALDKPIKVVSEQPVVGRASYLQLLRDWSAR